MSAENKTALLPAAAVEIDGGVISGGADQTAIGRTMFFVALVEDDGSTCVMSDHPTSGAAHIAALELSADFDGAPIVDRTAGKRC